MNGNDLLRWLLALVFGSAGLYKLTHLGSAYAEMARYGLPWWCTFLLIALELGIAVAFALAWRPRQVAVAGAVFMGLALLAALIAYPEAYRGMAELFTFEPTPTDIVLHGVFLVIFVALALRGKK